MSPKVGSRQYSGPAVVWRAHGTHSQTHITMDGQSVSPSWLRARHGTHDKTFAVGKTVLVLCIVGRPP